MNTSHYSNDSNSNHDSRKKGCEDTLATRMVLVSVHEKGVWTGSIAKP